VRLAAPLDVVAFQMQDERQQSHLMMMMIVLKTVLENRFRNRLLLLVVETICRFQ
jgi:hypothetical protein